jgi:FkbH-like protein
LSAAHVEDWDALAQSARAAGPGEALVVHSRVARAVARILAGDSLPKSVRPLRVALLRSFTAELLMPSITACLAEHNFAAAVEIGQLGNIAGEILQPDSFVQRGKFDVCVVAALAEHVLPDLDDATAAAARQAAIDEHLSQIERLAERFAGLVVAWNFAPPPAGAAPLLQAQSHDSGRYSIDRANELLAKRAARHANVVIADVAGLAARHGAEHFWSPRDMASSMQPLTPLALLALGRQLADLVLLNRAAPVKCLVLDCDNTLWGGVIGEDGLNGIQLGETYPGLCFQQFQRQLRALNRAGFLLALNSKNNEADVRRVFDEHPGMLLRPEHIAAERVNWQDKVANLTELAEELNIGLDSFVFIDDNDFEINLVRERLPQVRCLQVPREAWKLPALLAGARIVDRLAITAEDRKKAEMYVQERHRKQFKSQSGDLSSYLRGLEIKLTFEPLDPSRHLTRAAQLTQKTNQFNLTTRRFTESELTALSGRGGATFLAALSDRFGEYGRVALAIVTPDESAEVCHLHVFLMSCRVIGRGVESSFLRLVMRRMREQGRTLMRAEFIPTAKNAVCRDYLATFGFRESGRDADGRIAYEFDMRADELKVDDWITVA